MSRDNFNNSRPNRNKKRGRDFNKSRPGFNNRNESQHPNNKQNPNSNKSRFQRDRFLEDSFDKLYRASASSRLDPNLAIITTKQFEPDRSGLTQTKNGVVFFETVQQALSEAPKLDLKQYGLDSLYIVIHAESDRQIPELQKFGKVFAGNAWTTVHRRRLAEGWYLKDLSPIQAQN